MIHAFNCDQCDQFCTIESEMALKTKNQNACKHGNDGTSSIEIEDPAGMIARIIDYCHHHCTVEETKKEQKKKVIYCKNVSGEMFDSYEVDASKLKNCIKQPFNHALQRTHQIFDFSHQNANVVISRMHE